MLSKNFRQRDFYMRTLGVLIILIMVLFGNSCKWFKSNKNKGVPHAQEDPLSRKQPGLDTVSNRWGSWNILLKPGTNSAAASAAILAFENNMIDKFNLANPSLSGFTIHFDIFYCPCDSLLFNIGATLLDGNGESAVTPPPPPPSGGSGDASLVSFNHAMVNTDDTAEHEPPPYSTVGVKLDLSVPGKIMRTDTQILAVIDTGIDTGYFSSEIRKLIWTAPEGPTIFNTVYSNSADLRDDHIARHGSVVTALALRTLKEQETQLDLTNDLPRIMVLKALDKKKRGSTFTVSCALSYAIQHKAALVNASLGYYETSGLVDSVFRHYVLLCANPEKPITIFAAAGNLPGNRARDEICRPGTDNLLTSSRMFYPACFSAAFNHVFAVTSLRDSHTSCFYQNWSPEFVTLGVLQKNENSDTCCRFAVPFAIAEGTSFATPVASGMAMYKILKGQTAQDFLRNIASETGSPLATKGGRYTAVTH